MTPAHIRVAALTGGVALCMVVLIALATAAASGGSPQGSHLLQGDTDCNGQITSADALFVLRDVAGLPHTAACLDEAGDTDCDGQTTTVDALRILRHIAGLPNTSIEGCPPVGSPLDPPAPTATPAPTDEPTPTATPTPTPDPDATPPPTGPPTPTPTPAPVSPTATPEPTPAPGVCVPATPAASSASAGVAMSESSPHSGGYNLTPFATASEFQRLVDMAVIPGTDEQEAVVIGQHTGRLWRISLTGDPNPQLFGDVGDRINGGFEEGLLSIALSPGYEEDGCVYLYYTTGSDPNRQSRLVRFLVADNQLIDASEEILLSVPQFQNNHNGGRILFGPDGYLYLSLGDGGGSEDPGNHGQNKNTLLGTIVRLDVSGSGAYAIPSGNPFVGQDGLDEIWAYGLRNPWRFSFDRDTGNLWLADVGQGQWEEVNLMQAGGNYGWKCYEGHAPYSPEAPNCPSASELIFPRAVYPISGQPECAVIGGYVYRGAAMPELNGWYVYADFCSGRVFAFNTADASQPIVLISSSPNNVYSIAELPSGELLFLTASDTIWTLTRN